MTQVTTPEVTDAQMADALAAAAELEAIKKKEAQEKIDFLSQLDADDETIYVQTEEEIGDPNTDTIVN